MEHLSAATVHTSVLLDRCVELFAEPVAALVAAGVSAPVLVDATLGMGGHTHALLQQYPQVRVVGFDRDPQARHLAQQRLAAFASRVTIVPEAFDTLAESLAALDVSPEHTAGILFDLGVSSLQLDDPGRGFAYSQDVALDMRMNSTQPLTAAEILNTYPERELARLLRVYGEEKFARQLARAFVRRRQQRPWERTGELVDCIKDTIPAPARRTGGNPAKRTFQALRIEVNDELGMIERAIPQALAACAVGGRCVVMSFQSLEDRIVKDIFRKASTTTTPIGVPLTQGQDQAPFRLLTRGSEPATQAEIEQNSRAQSVRLRAIERVLVS